jgi:flagellar biosynthesis protein FlhA
MTSTATGIVVTRAMTGHSFGFDFTGQISRYPRAIGVVQVCCLSWQSSRLPFLPFFIMSAGTGYAAYALHREEKQKEELAVARESAVPTAREQRISRVCLR